MVIEIEKGEKKINDSNGGVVHPAKFYIVDMTVDASDFNFELFRNSTNGHQICNLQKRSFRGNDISVVT